MLVNICCSNSSGSTLLANLLDRHPEICSGPEMYVFSKAIAYENFERLKKLAILIRKFGITDNPYHPSRDFLRNLNCYGLKEDFIWRLLKTSDTFGSFIKQLKEIVTSNNHKPIWAEKTPPNIFFIHQFITLFADAKIIHIVRDPRDAILTSMGRGMKKEEGAAKWLASVAAVQKMRCYRNLLEIKYEDLVVNPDGTLKQICFFLDIEFKRTFFSCDTNRSKKIVQWKGFNSWQCDPSGGISAKSLGKYKKADTDFSELYSMRLSDTYAEILGTKQYTILELMNEYEYPNHGVMPGTNRDRPAYFYSDTEPGSIKLRIVDFITSNKGSVVRAYY